MNALENFKILMLMSKSYLIFDQIVDKQLFLQQFIFPVINFYRKKII